VVTGEGIKFIVGCDHPLTVVRALAEARGWVLQREPGGEPVLGQTFELVFEAVDYGAWIYFVVEPVSNVPYVVVFGGQRGATWVKGLKRELGALSPKEVAHRWDSAQSHEERIVAVQMLGIAADVRPTAAFLARFEAALCHVDFDVREAGIDACARTGWAEVAPFLSAMALADPAARLREKAATVRAMLRPPPSG